MRVALVSITKPTLGSGIGTTEYTHFIYEGLKRLRSVHVDLIYATEDPNKTDIFGMLYMNTLFKSRIRRLAKEPYDVIHIVSHEMGFAAKILKENGSKAKIVTKLHDFLRFEKDFNRGIMQKTYNHLVKWNIDDTVDYSDVLLFNSTQTRDEALQKYGKRIKKYAIVNDGIKDVFIKTPLKKKSKNRIFTIGYIGALAYHKNAIELLKASRHLDQNSFRFMIYGSGYELKNLKAYIKAHKISNVELAGFAPESRIVGIYDSFDAFVFPSIYEGFGIPIIEAQARGLPVIILRDARIPKEVRKYCFEAVDEKEMAKILKNLKLLWYDKKIQRNAMSYARSLTLQKEFKETFEAYNL